MCPAFVSKELSWETHNAEVAKNQPGTDKGVQTVVTMVLKQKLCFPEAQATINGHVTEAVLLI